MTSPWCLYDDLVAAVPPGVPASGVLLGWHWTMVRSRTVGIALSPPDRHVAPGVVGSVAGRSVRDLAALLKSWDEVEATVGLAAINSVLNTATAFEQLSGLTPAAQRHIPAFEHYADAVKGKRVAVVGHFPGLRELAGICELSVLERRPQPGDYPDPACEYLLPHQDFVFITSTAIINKTLPRLLELSRGAFVVLVGPSTPLTPLLFEHGVSSLAGTVVVDEESAWQAAAEGASRELFDHGGRMVRVEGPAAERAIT